MNISFTSTLGKTLAQNFCSFSNAMKTEAEKDPDPKSWINEDGSPGYFEKIDDNLIARLNKGNPYQVKKSLKDHGIENTLNIDEFIAKNGPILEKTVSPLSTNSSFWNTMMAFGSFFTVLGQPTNELENLPKDLRLDSEDYGWVALTNKYIDDINNTIKDLFKNLTPKDIDEIVKSKSNQ